MPNISSATTIQSVQLTEQTTAPATPSSGYFRLYASSGSLLRVVDDAGNDYALSTGGTAPDVSSATFVTLSTSSVLSAERVLTGVSNRITVDVSTAGVVSIYTPQDLHTAASVQFSTVSASTVQVTTVSASALTGVSTLSAAVCSASTFSGGTVNVTTVSASVVSGSTFSGGAVNVTTVSASVVSGSTFSGGAVNVTTVSASVVSGSTHSGGAVNVTTVSASVLSVGTGANSSASVTFRGQYFSELIASGPVTTDSAINWSSGNEHKVTLGASITLTFSNGVTGGRYVLLLVQDSTGSRTVNWPGAVKWGRAGVSTLSTTASTVDLFTFLFDGTSYYGNASLGF